MLLAQLKLQRIIFKLNKMNFQFQTTVEKLK